jgi:hypothetical protein
MFGSQVLLSVFFSSTSGYRVADNKAIQFMARSIIFASCLQSLLSADVLDQKSCAVCYWSWKVLGDLAVARCCHDNLMGLFFFSRDLILQADGWPL